MRGLSLYLKLWKKQLERVPDSVWEQTDLETLVLAETGLCEVPEEIGRLTRLRMLDLGHNALRSVPNGLGDLDGLTDFLYLQPSIGVADVAGETDEVALLEHKRKLIRGVSGMRIQYVEPD